MTTKILTYVSFVIAILLGYYLYYSINSMIKQKKEIVRVEQKVIEKLKLIRKVELIYQANKGKFTGNFDSLKSFIKNDFIYIINREEEIIMLDYGVDSLIVHIDTLGSIAVEDSLFNNSKFNIEELEKIPVSGKYFAAKANKIEKGNVLVDVVEVWDTAPINPNRNKDSKIKNQKPLRFGSLKEVTTAGNWE